jgi:uncharacterized protein GlcG (DUF336 family)
MKTVRTALAAQLIPLVMIGASPAAVAADEATFNLRQLTVDTALKAAQAALQKCRKDGFQIAVAVSDRAGNLQVLLRDRFAGAHTIEMASAKAWTAASFRRSTAALGLETQPGRSMSGIRNLPRVIAAGGGLPIEAGGQVLGAIGVSGGPGGEADDACADAGIKAIADAIEF